MSQEKDPRSFEKDPRSFEKDPRSFEKDRHCIPWTPVRIISVFKYGIILGIGSSIGNRIMDAIFGGRTFKISTPVIPVSK